MHAGWIKVYRSDQGGRMMAASDLVGSCPDAKGMVITRQSLSNEPVTTAVIKRRTNARFLRSVKDGRQRKNGSLNQPQPQPWFSRTNARGGLTTWACGTRGSHRDLALRRQCPKFRICSSRSFLLGDRKQARALRNAHCFTKCVLDRILIM